MYQTSARPAPLDFPLPPAHSIYKFERRKDILQSHPLHLPQPPTNYIQAPIRDGLRTPPADTMTTTYEPPQYASYASRQDAYPSAPPSANYSSAYSGSTQHSRSCSSLSQPPLTSQSLSYRSEVQNSRPAYSQPTSPQIPGRTEQHIASETMSQSKTSSKEVILPNLQIPKTINSSGGSLAEFAAQITCLFWFETSETLEKAERMTPGTFVKRLKNEAFPSSGFRKWVVTILSTTQVTQNVVLLALLFIYRLKKINPTVKGKLGSEYRLLTVALMLGNKFLDDNTYTNKTWAEVSGISVNEIHVMEVEFLSNMRYSLLASSDEWAEWQDKLSNFSKYCDQAATAPLAQYSPPVAPLLNSALPSPPNSLQASPPASQSYVSSLVGTPNPIHLRPEVQSQTITRKRSFEGDVVEPAAKRVARPTPSLSATYTPSSLPPINEAPRLPVPNLTISTNQANGYNGSSSFPQNVPLLPPLSGGGRAMASVYPPTSLPWNLPMVTPIGPPQQMPHPQSAGTPTRPSGTPTRRHSPHSVQELLSLGSSPTSAYFPHHNTAQNSPSIFLQQRNSPYKPIRNFDALLYPPPSASMHGYSVNVDEMRYQPLGKRNDYRTGMIPEYASRQSYQYNGPPPRQPNFHI